MSSPKSHVENDSSGSLGIDSHLLKVLSPADLAVLKYHALWRFKHDKAAKNVQFSKISVLGTLMGGAAYQASERMAEWSKVDLGTAFIVVALLAFESIYGVQQRRVSKKAAHQLAELNSPKSAITTSD